MKLKTLDYFFVLRPTLFFPVWTVSLAGFWAEERFGPPAKVSARMTAEHGDISLILVIAILTLMMGSAFILNQLFDVETDKINDKLYLIASGAVAKQAAHLEMILLMLSPILLFFFGRYDLFAIMVLIYLVTGYLYSGNPFHLKNRPYGGIFANLVGGLLIFTVGWNISGQLNTNLLFHALPYICGFLAVYFFTTIPDVGGDLQAGKITVAVKHGVKPVLITGTILMVVAVALAAVAEDIVAFLPTALSVPFFIVSLKTKSVKRVLEANKYATLFLSLMICYRFPFYLLIIIFIYFFCKWYYKKRFQVNYPSLKPCR
jgi:4-hydroxybenzoate polyprenyltransferase